MKKNSSGLFIVATPIGNLKDISERAKETIFEADLVICENPKHSLKLLNKLGIKKKLLSLHDYNETLVINKISKELSNKKIVLISDAGSPLISDPGFKLVKYCIENNIYTTSIPGSCSIIPALQLSGIPINEFSYLGFFPKSKNKMKLFINEIKNSIRTSVFFVSSNKLIDCLNFIQSEDLVRTISISKELTKINENVLRGSYEQIISQITNQQILMKGEFVVVVEGKSIKKTKNINLSIYNDTITVLLSKFSLTEVVEIVHKLIGINKNKIYKWVLKLKKYQN